MSNQIEVYSKLNDREGLDVLGNAICRSGMFGAETKEQGIVIALQCMVECKPPLELAKTYHIIQGKLSKRADAMLADFRKAGGKFKFLDLKNVEIQKAEVTFEDYEKLEVSYSIDDAKMTGVWSEKTSKGAPSMWVKYPQSMLRARLVSETLRAIAPEIVTGVYTPEEVQQFDDIVEAKPSKSVLKQAEVIEPEIVDEPVHTDKPLDEQLKTQIGKDEALVNNYWRKKKKIDETQEWSELPEEMKQAMLDDFPNFLKAVKGGKK